MTKPKKSARAQGGPAGAKPTRAARGPAAARPARASGIPFALVVVGAAVVAFCVHAGAMRFTQDDAYISMRYAKNLVEGHGLVFNPGERVEGYTNFAWTLLLALVMKLKLPLESTATVLGTLFGAGAIVVAARFARALEGHWGTASAGTAVLLAGSSALALWCTGGLETGMFVFFVTIALERGLSPAVPSRGRLLAPVFFVLASLTRPEGPLFFASWFAIRAADTFLPGGGPARAATVRELVRDALVFALPLAAYAAWKLSYFGDVLPNTYYAKAGFSRDYVQRGLAYAKEFFLAYGAFGIAPLLAFFAAWRSGIRGVETRLLAVWLVFALYVVWIGGDVLYMHRFWLPILPIGCILVARGVALLASRAHGLAPALAAASVALLVGGGLALNWSRVQERRTVEIGFVGNMTQTGQWLGANLPSGSTIAITTIGAISYFSGLKVIDLLGLTDREIARNPKPIEGLGDTWREINYNAESVIVRRPDAILFSTGVRPSHASEKALFLYKSFQDSYYSYFFRSSPSRASAQTMFKLRSDAPPVELSLLPVESFEFIDEYGKAHLALTYDKDLAGAALSFERAWKLSGDSFLPAKEWWGTALYDAKDPRAMQILHEVVNQDSFAVTSMIRLGDEALRRGDLPAARGWFERVSRADPHDSVPWAGLAEVERLSRNFPRARELATIAVRLCDANAGNLVILGNLEAQAGELERARALFHRALSADPSSDAAKRGLDHIEAIRAGRTP